jgi:hypothetical protein
MRGLFLNLLFVFAVLDSLAQTGDAGQQLIRKKCGAEHISLPLDKNAALYPTIFDSIRVLDFRRDTSRIGLISTGRNAQDEVLFHWPAADQLARYMYAGYSSSQGGQSLLVVIKDLWISDPQGYVNLNNPFWTLYFRLEAYLKKKDGYIPLTYLDTTVQRMSGYSLPHAAAHQLPGLIDMFMQKVAALDQLGGWAEKRTISYEQIDSFSRTRFDYPMDTVMHLMKGVYVNVEEFRNNAPSILQYELSNDKSGNMELRIPDENGHLYYTHTVWGFCDGKQAYVMMDGNLFPVFPVQHQFYVLGSKVYRDKKVWVPLYIPLGPLAFAYGFTSVSENVVRSLRLFRLDSRTGMVTE